MGSYQIWLCHVTQAKHLSFPYTKCYCPLNFGKIHHISWFCCSPNGSYKEDNLKEGRMCPSPMWNRVNKIIIMSISTMNLNGQLISEEVFSLPQYFITSLIYQSESHIIKIILLSERLRYTEVNLKKLGLTNTHIVCSLWSCAFFFNTSVNSVIS